MWGRAFANGQGMNPQNYSEISMTTMLGVLIKMRDEKDRHKVVEAINEAYPFPERKGYPYKAWLGARREFCAEHSLPIKRLGTDSRQGLLDLRQRVDALTVGAVIQDKHGRARVMAIADGYAMCRRNNSFPFVIRIARLQAEGWEAVEQGRANKKR